MFYSCKRNRIASTSPYCSRLRLLVLLPLFYQQLALSQSTLHGCSILCQSGSDGYLQSCGCRASPTRRAKPAPVPFHPPQSPSSAASFLFVVGILAFCGDCAPGAVRLELRITQSALWSMRLALVA